MSGVQSPTSTSIGQEGHALHIGRQKVADLDIQIPSDIKILTRSDVKTPVRNPLGPAGAQKRAHPLACQTSGQDKY